jgi:hypothetical protein
MPLEALQPQIVPHLVSRLIYTGAGGFNPFSRGLEFTLSPRAAHLRQVVSGNSTSDRGIWHTKTEALSAGYRRLHVLCGESLCSQTATFLKVGVTALIVALADAELAPGSAVQLAEPLVAMQNVAADVTCQRPLRMADGRCLTAIAIQRHYLQLAEAHLGDSFMPAWAAEVCCRWRAVLDQLEDAPNSVSQTLDWGIKLALYAHQARSFGVRWEDVGFWNQAIERLAAALDARQGRRKPVSIERVIGSKSPIPEEVAALDPLLQSRGLQWEDAKPLLRSRQKFYEIDTRFGQLGPQGIFEALDLAGVLNHRVSGVDNIEHAMAEPPATGRAGVRGQVIRRLAGAGKAQCDWQRIVNFQEKQMLDLSDPFTHKESWRPFRPEDVRDARLLQLHAELRNSVGDTASVEAEGVYSRREAALEHYRRGDFRGAEELLQALLHEGFEAPSTHCHLARVLLMMDREAEAREQIDRAGAIRGEADAYVVGRILFFQCVFAMFDGADIAPAIQQIRAALSTPLAHADWTIRPLLDHLRPRVGEPNYQFLKALSEALSSANAMPRLDQFPQWRDAAGAAAD